jgi:hypothetical protein
LAKGVAGATLIAGMGVVRTNPMAKGVVWPPQKAKKKKKREREKEIMDFGILEVAVAPQILIVLFLIYLFDNIIQLISLRSLWYYGGW